VYYHCMSVCDKKQYAMTETPERRLNRSEIR
jgi:hypothetical protein